MKCSSGLTSHLPQIGIQQAGRAIGVISIVTSHYLSEGGNLEITVEAVDVGSNRTVWRGLPSFIQPAKLGEPD